MNEYAVIFEQEEKGWSVYVPDLPGCVSQGDTLEEAKENIEEAIRGHVATLEELKRPVPPPSTKVSTIMVPKSA